MDLFLLNDDDLESMRRAPKTIVNKGARWVTKGGHRERNYVLHDTRDATQTYRLFLRVSCTKSSAFSVGLARVWSPDELLVLVRYNGPYHAHGNVIERTKAPVGCHKHLATQRYIQANLDPNGYAESIHDYNSVEGAFECLCRDCSVDTLNYRPFQAELEF